ncbi:hypothetical protein [Pectobacterium odoriferum]|uniref:hypothetical protein n=1 Tax=Pectobacterium odoriferum TaxID=78398 RepID=UPI003B973EF5
MLPKGTSAEPGWTVRGRESEAERGEIGEEVRAGDRAGNAVAECLWGIADDAWAYATGQRAVKRTGQSLESAGGALERATEAFEPVVQQHELAVAHQR